MFFVAKPFNALNLFSRKLGFALLMHSTNICSKYHFMNFLTEKKLSIEKKEVEMNISIAEDFSIPCHITQQSSKESQFQVTWFWQQGTEVKTIFTAYRNSTLQARNKNVVVRYDHSSPHQFDLTVLKSNLENSGIYFCEVEEWIHAPADGWRKHAVEKSGNLNVTVDAEGKLSIPLS